MHSGELVPELMAALMAHATRRRDRREGCREAWDTAWCRWQCAVPLWGRRVARARARASAGEDGKEGASASFIDEVSRFAWRRKNLGRHCARRPRFMVRWVQPYLHDGLFNIVSILAGFHEME